MLYVMLYIILYYYDIYYYNIIRVSTCSLCCAGTCYLLFEWLLTVVVYSSPLVV